MSKKLSILSMIVAGLALSATSLGLSAAEVDEKALAAKVTAQVNKIESAGLLLSNDEIEIIGADIVATEIEQSELTLEQAVEKYALPWHVERYIRIKQASQMVAKEGSGNGQIGDEPPTP